MAFALWAGAAGGQDVKVTLSGDQEIPPVTTPASGTGTISVAADGSVTGTVTITGMKATVAHIHDAAPGKNGPIAIPLVKVSDTVWALPPGAKLTEAQLASFRAGTLYYNIHSEAWRAGEIRGQIRP
ncbi:MAG TPA: CHRD domain-containing protein [Casimicrobiaceae bacterium]|nr:CHRD domain-containing protein [Casimicrobiaceae bacterium]